MGLLSSPGRPAKGWGEGAGILARATAVLWEGESAPRREESRSVGLKTPDLRPVAFPLLCVLS